MLFFVDSWILWSRIRDAYEILSDPVKMLLYDTGGVQKNNTVRHSVRGLWNFFFDDTDWSYCNEDRGKLSLKYPYITVRLKVVVFP